MRPLFFSLALAVALVSAWLPARADNVFAVSGVHVDASASSASEAQLSALAQGRPKAWQILFRRLTRAQDWPRQPMLDDIGLQRIVRGFEVNNEKRSTTRYVADITYDFNPDAVARLLQAAAIPYTQLQAKRVLLVPMAPGFARGSPWTAALASPRFATGAVPFSLPGGGDLAGLAFETANWADVEAVAARIHASEAVLVLATPAPGHLTITLKRLGAGQIPVKSSVDVPLVQGGAQFTYPVAADAAVRAVDEMWKSHSAVDFSQKGRLIADMRISSLGQWGAVQNQLASVPNVSAVNVLAMDIGEVRFSLAYLGTPEQLRVALAAAGIVLVNRGGEWSVSAAPPAGPAPP
jgi:hypothetical protein